MSDLRWEHGSEFHWVDHNAAAKADPDNGVWTSTGRDGFRLLLQHGRRERGWRRVWIPSYFCQEVVDRLLETGIECALYPDRPGCVLHRDNILAGQGDVVLVVNQLGLRGAPQGFADPSDPLDVIEDHTHDPWSDWARTSKAEFCLASLRKCLPLPDGTRIWSPSGQPLPAAPALRPMRELAILRKLEGMLLKRAYLAGDATSKDTFRALQVAGERDIADGSVSGVSPIGRHIGRCFDAERWRAARTENWTTLRTILADTPGIRVLSAPAGGVAFSSVVLCDNNVRREALRTALISARIYPAVLWSLEQPRLPGVTKQDLEFSRRMLSVHCDGRYDTTDMVRVASAIRTFANEVTPRGHE